MFCPICRTEYREGFTICADCRISLVEGLPPESALQAFAALWSGESPAFRDRLLEELEKEKIAAFGVPLEVLFRNTVNLFGLRSGPRFGFAICVARSDYPAASAVLKYIFKTRSTEADVAAESIHFKEETTIDVPSELPLYWDPETATVEIWNGEEQERAAFIQNSLQGVGVPARFHTADSRVVRLRVRPEDEVRAKELVRQISEGAVPEKNLSGEPGFLWLKDAAVDFSLLYVIVGLDITFLIFGILSAKTKAEAAGFIFFFLSVFTFVSNIGSWWMLYQAVRYEIYQRRFILISFVPMSFVWYYLQRYSKRRGIQRMPIALRLRMSQHPSA